jgi:hypothetical protein
MISEQLWAKNKISVIGRSVTSGTGRFMDHRPHAMLVHRPVAIHSHTEVGDHDTKDLDIEDYTLVIP